MRRALLPVSRAWAALPLMVALPLMATPSHAAIQITIAQDGPHVVARAIGSLPPAVSSNELHCGGFPGLLPHGGIAPSIGAICLGSGAGWAYRVTGPSSIDGLARLADASSGSLFGVNGALGLLASASTTVNSSSTWHNITLADFGLQPGSIASWQVAGGEPITLAVAPSPLGILGAVCSWRASRQLRHRIRGAV